MTRDVLWLKQIYYPSSNLPSIEPAIFRAIEAPYSIAGENHNANKTSEQASKSPAPSKLKVTIAGITILPTESNDEEKRMSDNKDKSILLPAEQPFKEAGIQRSRIG